MSNGTYAVIFFIGAFCVFFVLKWLVDKSIEFERRVTYRYLEKRIKFYEESINYLKEIGDRK